MMSAVLVTAFLNLMVKQLGHLPSWQLVLYRSIGGVVLSAMFLFYKRNILATGNFKWLLVRALSGTVALVLFYKGLSMLPLASAVTIFYLGPVFGMLVSVLVLNEKAGLRRWLGTGVSFLGVVAIKGFDPETTLTGVLICLGAAFFAGITDTFTRRMKSSNTPESIIFYTSLISTIIIVPYVFVPGKYITPNPIDGWLIGGIMLAGQLGQLLLIRAFHREPIYRVAPLVYLGTVYALLLGYFFFGDVFNWKAIAGMGLVIAGNLINIYRKKR